MTHIKPRAGRGSREGGFVVSAELALIATILVIGLIVGLVSVRDALVAEMHDIAQALGELDQSFDYDGIINPDGPSQTEGGRFDDRNDRSISGGPNGGQFSSNATIGGDITALDYLDSEGDEGLVAP